MGHEDQGLIITSRRNFFVRALGFSAAVAVPAAAVALAPMVTPALIASMDEWKRAWRDYVAAQDAALQAPFFIDHPGGTLSPERERYFEERDRENQVRMKMLRAIGSV